jgi:hypothetical protein
MRKFLFVLASTATLTMISSAIAQYVAPPLTNPLQDRQLREFYEKQRPLNNATGSGSVGVTDPTGNYVGQCAIGSSEETCRRRGQKYNPPPRQN